MNYMMKVRKIQFLLFAFCGFGYFFIYRPYASPKAVMNSVLYHKALRLLKSNAQVQTLLGPQFHMMTCNGKYNPLSNHCSYYMVLFGAKDKAKVTVSAELEKESQNWNIKEIDLHTLEKSH